MKKFFYVLAVVGVVLTGCKEDDAPKSNQLAFEFAENVSFTKNVDSQAGKESFSFQSNVDSWTAKSSADWLTVSPTSGKKGIQVVTIAFAANEQDSEREGKITVSSGDNVFVITLKQEAKKDQTQQGGTDFEFAPNINFERRVGYEAGKTTFSFKSNVESWNATSSVSWLTVTPNSGGKESQTLTINFILNEELERTGTITVSSADNLFVIKITQEENGLDIFSVMDDATFKEYCKPFDINKDNKLFRSEANMVTTIKVSGTKSVRGTIKSLKGIEYFLNLKALYCAYNQITSLDVSKNTALETLDCYSNQLTSLDVSGCTALKKLGCSDNQLTSLDVSKNTALTSFDCGVNKLSSLGVSKNTALTYLKCSGNQLTSLDVSKNVALDTLYCSANRLSSLDVSNNTALTRFDCDGNNLSSLDVSNNTALIRFVCGYNNLSSLDVSKNTALAYFDCGYNKLSSLDVSKNTALAYFDCGNNQLSSLDVSNNTKLWTFECRFNPLETLYMKTGQTIYNFFKPAKTEIVYK